MADDMTATLAELVDRHGGRTVLLGLVKLGVLQAQWHVPAGWWLALPDGSLETTDDMTLWLSAEQVDGRAATVGDDPADVPASLGELSHPAQDRAPVPLQRESEER